MPASRNPTPRPNRDGRGEVRIADIVKSKTKGRDTNRNCRRGCGPRLFGGFGGFCFLLRNAFATEMNLGVFFVGNDVIPVCKTIIEISHPLAGYLDLLVESILLAFIFAFHSPPLL